MNDSVGPDRWRRIEEILDAALDLPAARRAAFLEDACAGDVSLRAEVESLLAAHARAGDYLETPVASLQSVLAAPYRPGQAIGPYRLLNELGRGGLGIVWLAMDTRLGRRVALKLLPASRLADIETRTRFRREASAASALDHPQVCTVYEIGESDAGDPYIAMAYVEGETVKEKIARGPLSLSDAVEYATQVARGLAHAHGHGIVHRDVKPANLIVTPEGQVRIVDFGLARWIDASTLTREGVTPGTVSYMSPEQIQGEEVDQRTDIWALGVVLYEMITGRPPFRGETGQSRTYAILNQEPEPLTALRAGVPLTLEPVLAKVLAKDREKRYQHVDEVPVDLRSAMEGRAGRIPGAVRSIGWRSGRTALSLVLAGVLVGALLATLVLGRGSGPESQLPVHLSVTLPPEHEFLANVFRRFAISPDGIRMVYAARGATGGEQLYLRSLDREESVPISGTENARDPFFSPDGRWVGFFAGEELRKVSLEGGVPQKISDAPAENSRGASWAPDGTIILPLGQLSGLFRVSAAGGVPAPLTDTGEEPGRAGHYFPQVLPDGRHVLFTLWTGAEWRTAILTLDSGTWEVIAEGCAAARYLPTGHLVCAEMAGVLPTGTLLTAPLDLDRQARVDSFVSVPWPAGSRVFDFAVSGTGTLVYAATKSFRPRTLAWVDREGRSTRFAGDVDGYFTPSISPDGKRAAFTRLVEAGREELWLRDLETGSSARLTGPSLVSNLPLWTPGGDAVLFNSLQSPPGIYRVPHDLSDTATVVLPRGDHILVPGSFSPGGGVLAYTELHDRTLGDVWTLSLDDGARTALIRTPANERSPQFSPNGRWLAYTSDVSGPDQIYVQAYPGPGPPIQVSTDGGRAPVWSPGGDALYFRHGEALMAVPVQTGGSFAAGPPLQLFTGRFAAEYKGAPNYDIAPDGRFLMVEVEPASEPDRLHVVLNWFEELERLLPAGQSAEG